MDGHSHSLRPSRHRERAAAEPALTGPFVKATDAGLAAAIFVLPIVMGGRQAWGNLILGFIACFTVLAWSLQQITADRPRWRWSGAEPLFVMGLALLFLQVFTLPDKTLHAISPELAKLLPLWVDGGAFGRWTTISLTPDDTLANTMSVASCMLLFVVAVQRMQRVEDAKRLMTWIGWSAAGMAAFGVLQLALGNGKFFWFYEHPFTDASRVAKGAFTNANHFAHFVALGVPIWLWRFAAGESLIDHSSDTWRSSREKDARTQFDTIVACVCLCVIGAALLLSQSRGGVVVAAGGVAVTLVFLWWQKLIGLGTSLMICGLGAVCGISLLAFGGEVEHHIEQGLAELTTVDVEKFDEGEARRKIWNANLAGARKFLILGTGLGSHVEVYPTWYDNIDNGVEYTHAENGYLQIALETGMTGLTIVGLFVLLVAYWCIRGMRLSRTVDTAAPLAAISAAMAMNLAHSLTDFIWYVPACMVACLLLAACALRLYQLAGPAVPVVPEGARVMTRAAWASMAVGVLAFATFAIKVEWPIVAAEPHWFDYVRLTQAQKSFGENEDRPTDLGLVKRRLSAAVAAARANPRFHRAQLAVARAYVQYVQVRQDQSENAMPLTQLRDAARSNFETHEEMLEWLDKPAVLGDRRKMLEAADLATRRALRLCPLAARGYLLLNDLGWLTGSSPEQEQEFLAQAYESRPYDARVHFVLGREDFAKQQFDSALAHWREAFDRDRNYRRQLILSLAAHVPAKFFLDNFDVEVDSLHLLREAYRESPDRKGYETIVTELAAAECQSARSAIGDQAVIHWLTACGCYAELEEHRLAIAAAKRAVKANPASFQARQALGNYLFDRGEYAAAAEHLTWCVRRHPDDDRLRERAEAAIMEKGLDATRMAREIDDDSSAR